MACNVGFSWVSGSLVKHKSYEASSAKSTLNHAEWLHGQCQCLRKGRISTAKKKETFQQKFRRLGKESELQLMG